MFVHKCAGIEAFGGTGHKSVAEEKHAGGSLQSHQVGGEEAGEIHHG
jgi:hypothetical protein